MSPVKFNVTQTLKAAVRTEALPLGSIHISEAREVQWCRRIQTHAFDLTKPAS